MKIDIKFNIGDKCNIKELNIPGVVRQIEISQRGTGYEVRYFWNSEVKTVVFYEDELEFTSSLVPDDIPVRLERDCIIPRTDIRVPKYDRIDKAP